MNKIKHIIKKGFQKLGYKLAKQHKVFNLSETSKCRARLAPYCIGNGLDLGFGGDAITESAVRVDFANPYSRTAGQPVQLGGDCLNLEWFRDGSLDYVYSSHLLEDFKDTAAALREWLRVLKPGGLLILFCPDEQKYRTHCKKTGQYYNEYHKHEDFSLSKVKQILASLGQRCVVHENPLVDAYSWELVIKKT